MRKRTKWVARQSHGSQINSNKRRYYANIERKWAAVAAVAIVVLKHDLPMFIDFSHSVTICVLPGICGFSGEEKVNNTLGCDHKDLHALKALDDCHLNTQRSHPADAATSRNSYKCLPNKKLYTQGSHEWASEKEQTDATTLWFMMVSLVCLCAFFCSFFRSRDESSLELGTFFYCRCA